jgi:hypothetical protein
MVVQMPNPPTPATLDDLGDRFFSFYPPILNIEHNEWRMKKAEWSEVLVENPKMAIELWVPRTWLGEISKVDEPHVIVGLRREVEYKGGTLAPHHRKVIDLPQPHSAAPLPVGERPKAPTAVDQIRGSNSAESSVTKALFVVLISALVLVFAFVGLQRIRSTGGNVQFQSVVQADLGFTNQSTYFDVVNKLGTPDEDRWRPGEGERKMRALVYQKQQLIVLLMGVDQSNAARYIGAKDLNWQTVHTVSLSGGRTTDSMLRSLQRF